MATLLPSLSSDEEDSGKTCSKDVSGKDSISSKKGREVSQVENDDSSDDSSEDEVDAEFEFGGLLVCTVRNTFLSMLKNPFL